MSVFRIPPPPPVNDFILYQLWNSYVNELQRFSPFPDLYENTNATYYYFGWESVNGDWLIRRRTKASSHYTDCNSHHNPSHPDLESAWTDRETLTYP